MLGGKGFGVVVEGVSGFLRFVYFRFCRTGTSVGALLNQGNLNIFNRAHFHLNCKRILVPVSVGTARGSLGLGPLLARGFLPGGLSPRGGGVDTDTGPLSPSWPRPPSGFGGVGFGFFFFARPPSCKTHQNLQQNQSAFCCPRPLFGALSSNSFARENHTRRSPPAAVLKSPPSATHDLRPRPAFLRWSS